MDPALEPAGGVWGELQGSLKTLRACPGCGGRALTLAYRPDLWRCDDCGLYLRNPRPSLDAIREYYDRGVTYRRFRRERAVRDMLWAKRLRLVRRFRASGRLLDVGTGDGHFLRLAGAHFEVEGTEVSREGVRLAHEAGLAVRHGTLAELSLEPGSYDVVTLWHVLEHLTDPSAEIVRIRRLLAPGGHMVVAVPNELRLLDGRRLLGSTVSPFGPLRPGDEIHLIHFIPPVLAGFLRRHGLRVLKLGSDDVDTVRSLASRGRELLWRSLGALALRRWSTAMFAVARLPGEA